MGERSTRGPSPSLVKSLVPCLRGHPVNARSSRILSGSCTACGLRHGVNTCANPRSRPTAAAVLTSSTDPVTDTTRSAEPSMRNEGYQPVAFCARKVLLLR